MGTSADDGEHRDEHGEHQGASREPDTVRYRTFRGRFTTPTAWAMGAALAVGCVFVALVAEGPGSDSALNRVSTIVVGLFFALLTVRFAAVRAEPDRAGLTVVNYARRRRLDWAEIVAVRFGSGDPWVHLDLADGTVLAVMAVQRADGEHGMNEARRLVKLIAEHGEAADPGPGHPHDG
ncbi:PH domain-containing protein [Myceligenerans indicum]|nr:PH domain-containing protein [Myceligenerans indicum]